MAKDRSYEFTGRKKHDFGRGSRWCKRCGDYTAVIQKYDLMLCRRCFREVATSLGFRKNKWYNMPATNILANLFVTLYNNETRRKGECTILPTSKLGIEVLKTLQKDGYIGEFEHIDDKRGGKFKINLLAKITKCGAITPRFKVKTDEFNNWEQQYLPAYDRGMLLVTTNQGVMSHHEATQKGIGGFLIGYVY